MNTTKNADQIVANLKFAARLGGEGGTYTGDAGASDDDSKCSLSSVMAAAVMGMGYAANDGPVERLDRYVEAHQLAQRYQGVCSDRLVSAIQCLADSKQKNYDYDATPALQMVQSMSGFRAWLKDGCPSWTWTNK